MPLSLPPDTVITIKDGVTFLGIKPVPATDLGRTKAVEIRDGGPLRAFQDGDGLRPTLLINNYNYFNQDKPIDPNANPDALDDAFSGFGVEAANVNDYPDFAAFQKHMAEATLAVVERVDTVPGVDHKAKVVNFRYKSGSDTMEADYVPSYTGTVSQRVPTDSVWPMRKVNGQWPYLPDGIVRDSSHSQQGRTGLLEKNGAALHHQPGCMGYLLTGVGRRLCLPEPASRPQYMVMNAPGNLAIKADGKLGLAQIVVHSKANKIAVDYALKPDQHTPDMASALYVFGCGAAPTAVLNGKPVSPWRPSRSIIKRPGASPWGRKAGAGGDRSDPSLQRVDPAPGRRLGRA